MEQRSQNILTNLENKIFPDDEFLVFLDDLKERHFLTEEVYFELKKSLEEKEVKNILKIWVQAEALYYPIEYSIATGVLAMVVSNIGEINYNSLSTGALVYAGIMLPTIMVSRLSILSILTHYTKVPERKKFISTGIIPLIPSQIFIIVWLWKHRKFVQCLRAKELRKKIKTEINPDKKQKLLQKEEQILLGKDAISKVISFVEGAIDRLKIPFKN